MYVIILQGVKDIVTEDRIARTGAAIIKQYNKVNIQENGTRV